MEVKKDNKGITKLLRKAKGVTMLALIVTIIVLLILAAITLNLAVGENGIIERAKLARDKSKNASIAEQEAMNQAAGEIDNAGNGGSSGGGSGEGGTCPECPDVSELENTIKELQNTIASLEQQLANEKANKAELEKQITDLNKQIADLNAQIESQKEQIADLQGQLSSKNQELAKKDETIRNLQETVDRLNNQIEELNRQIETLKAKQATGNALVSEVLAGKTFSNSSGVGLVGTMANRAGQIVAWSGYETISVQPHPDDNSQGLVTISNQYGADGYYNGNSKITGNVANLNANNIKAGVNVGRFDGTAGITGTFTSDGTATANNLSNGATAYVNGQKITGNGTDVNNAYNNGHSAGYNEGYNAGHSAGYNEGYNAASTAMSGEWTTSETSWLYGWTSYGGNQSAQQGKGNKVNVTITANKITIRNASGGEQLSITITK